MNNRKITETELIILLSDFYEKDFTNNSPERRRLIKNYRKVEKDSFKQLRKNYRNLKIAEKILNTEVYGNS